MKSDGLICLIFWMKSACSVSADSSLLMDRASNAFVAVVDGLPGYRAQSFTADNVSPTLAFFALDLEHTMLKLTFSESVKTLTLMYTGITLQAAADISMSRRGYTLTAGTHQAHLGL